VLAIAHLSNLEIRVAIGLNECIQIGVWQGAINLPVGFGPALWLMRIVDCASMRTKVPTSSQVAFIRK
jgi:hypothetical protein